MDYIGAGCCGIERTDPSIKFDRFFLYSIRPEIKLGVCAAEPVPGAHDFGQSDIGIKILQSVVRDIVS